MTRLNDHEFLDSQSFPYHIGVYEMQPHFQVPPHSHEFVELAYISGGLGRHQYLGTDFEIVEGDVFIIEPDQQHAYYVDAKANLTVYNVMFQPTLISHEISLLSQVTSFVDFFYLEPFLRRTAHFQSHLRLKPSDRLEMKTLLDRLVLEYKEKRLGYQLLTKTKLLELFIFLSRCYDTSQKSNIPPMLNDEKIIFHIREFIKQHFAKPLTLQQVSQLCGMSPSTFSAKFKLYTGRTFIEFRNDIRVHHAAERLITSDDKIIAIAHAVGFDDLSFFNKVFKLHFHCSPREYRELNR